MSDRTKSTSRNRCDGTEVKGVDSTDCRNDEHKETRESSSLHGQLEQLVELLSGRSSMGSDVYRSHDNEEPLDNSDNILNVNEDQVENKINSILSQVLPTPKPSSKKISSSVPSTSKTNASKPIVLDQDYYDDDDEGDTDGNQMKSNPSMNTTINRSNGMQARASDEQEKPEKTDDCATLSTSMEIADLDDVPLGRTGARMMITFGDGPKPNPKACAKALMGTRQCLQNAVKDARALRRKERKEYKRAKVQANLHRAKPKDLQLLISPDSGVKNDGRSSSPFDNGGNEIRSDMLFEAMVGYSKIAYDLQSGFDETQLETLFPEEMRSYQRWRKMHKAYTDSKGSDNDKKKHQDTIDEEQDEGDEPVNANVSDEPESMTNDWGGHLHNRLAQFDARTDRMKEAWYLAFSEVRQGSFLERHRTQEHQEWEKIRKTKTGRAGNSKRNRTSWAQLPSSHVSFLHWIGFDPGSALLPPDHSTTEALAFLAYDFMGKIVEKAIFLRCMSKLKEHNMKNRPESAHMLLQLDANEQLSEEDIDRSLNDSTMTSKALYNASTSTLAESAGFAQLYFGPGFESRIEMELDQICSKRQRDAKEQASSEEIEIRIKEDALFKDLKKPPKLLEGVMDLLGDEYKSEELIEKRLSKKKRDKKKDEDRTSMMNSLLSTSPTKLTTKGKKRGRPKSQEPCWKRPRK